MVTSIIPSLHKEMMEVTAELTDSDPFILMKFAQKKTSVYIMIMIFLEKVKSFLTGINSLKHGS